MKLEITLTFFVLLWQIYCGQLNPRPFHIVKLDYFIHLYFSGWFLFNPTYMYLLNYLCVILLVLFHYCSLFGSFTLLILIFTSLSLMLLISVHIDNYEELCKSEEVSKNLCDIKLKAV